MPVSDALLVRRARDGDRAAVAALVAPPPGDARALLPPHGRRRPCGRRGAGRDSDRLALARPPARPGERGGQTPLPRRWTKGGQTPLPTPTAAEATRWPRWCARRSPSCP